MMKYRLPRFAISAAALLLILSFVSANILAQTDADQAQVRFVHVVPGAAAIDIYTDGQLTISNLEYGSASTYVYLPAGPHQIAVTQTGTKTPLWEQQIEPAAAMAYTLIADSTDNLTFRVYQDDLNVLDLGKARFTAIHAVAGGPAVDIILPDGRPIISELAYQQEYGTLDVPTFNYEMAVVPTGESIENALVGTDAVGTAGLATGTYYSLIVYGSAPQVETLLLSAPTLAEGDSGYVRLAHGVAEAPAVDVYINDTLVAPSLAFGSSTEFIALPAGEHTAAIRAAGTDSDIVTTDLTVESGMWATAIALGTLEDISIGLFPNDSSAITADQSVINVINGVPGESSIAVSLGDGETTIDVAASGEAGASIVEPGDQTGNVSITLDGETTDVELPIDSFYGGIYYEILAAGEGEVIVFDPVSVAQTTTSAPIEETMAVAAAGTPGAETTTDPLMESEVVMSTPTTAADANAQPTTAPVTPSAEETLAPAATVASAPVSTEPTGRVILDPGANIQLRQYPTSGALSLGLAPSGATLTVNGRAGEPESITGSATQIPADATPFVDPATLLPDEDADLNPADTWLNVSFNTPDGGQIVAWVNALYIDVRDPAGNRQRLADLPTIPANLPGEARDTVAVPPTARENVVNVIVGNLDEGVNLHIRRTPDETSESLALVSTGTEMELVGISQDASSVFVSYDTPEGTTVTGWVNPLYITYAFNDSPITLPLLQERNLLPVTPIETLGGVTTTIISASPGTNTTPNIQAQVTADPLRGAIVAEVLLDTGANLHLRRRPDVNAESLALLPDGTRLEVIARTGSGEWLEVTFEDQLGYVNSRFVALTLNGQPFRLIEVPLIEGEVDTASTAATPVPGLTQFAPAGTPGTPLPGVTPAVTAAPTTPRTPAVITGDLVDMTISPGGASLGLPLLRTDEEVNLVFYSNDGFFALVERIDLPQAPPGWVPAASIRAK